VSQIFGLDFHVIGLMAGCDQDDGGFSTRIGNDGRMNLSLASYTPDQVFTHGWHGWRGNPSDRVRSANVIHPWDCHAIRGQIRPGKIESRRIALQETTNAIEPSWMTAAHFFFVLFFALGESLFLAFGESLFLVVLAVPFAAFSSPKTRSHPLTNFFDVPVWTV
jgi:hypothetical protein